MLRRIALLLLVALTGCSQMAGHALASALPAPTHDNAGFYMLLGLVILAGYGIDKAVE